MRRILAFDTSTEHIAIGLAETTGPERVPRMIAERDFEAPRAALGALLPAVRDLVMSTGLAMRDISIVAVGRGPGSFTGVRIAVASAKGVAHGLSAPLVGFGTLDAVAWRFSHHTGLLCVVGDAMRGEVYPALFRCHNGRCERLDVDRVEKPESAAASLATSIGEPVLLTGNGLAKHGDVFVDALGERATVAEESLWTPTGAACISAAWAESGHGSLHRLVGIDPVTAVGESHAATLLPVYTRLSDAEEAERRRVGGVPPSGVHGPGAGG